MTTELFPFKPELAHQHLPYWITFSLIPRFGKARLSRVAAFCDYDVESFFQMSDKSLKQLGFDEEQVQVITQMPAKAVSNIEAWLEKSDLNYILTINNPKYPDLLRETTSPPLVLFGTGNQLLLAKPQLAIVGSRNPSESGKQNAISFARELAGNDCVITSGLAMGIDSFAHKGALTNVGKTVAVLGCGIDICYPKRNAKLSREILEQGGSVVSEFVPGTPPLAHHFPRRNRIISGLSLGTLVVEAAIKSGSLITAYYALQQNREVFAIPGNINNPLTRGCHHLIKQGAKLVEQVADILEEFSATLNNGLKNDEKKLQKSINQRLATDVLLDSVDYDTTSIDLVAQRSGLPVSVVLTKLLEYELRGVVTSVPGGYIKLGD